jgi:hypothetical protein
MKAFARILILVALIGVMAACTRTYISTGDPGVPSPDASTTRICWTIHGAYGRSYIDKTKKLVDVCIKRGNQPEPRILVLERYKFVASDLEGHAQWISPDEVSLEFYDYGDGVSGYDARKSGASSNHIRTLVFHRIKEADKFVQKK